MNETEGPDQNYSRVSEQKEQLLRLLENSQERIEELEQRIARADQNLGEAKAKAEELLQSEHSEDLAIQVLIVESKNIVELRQKTKNDYEWLLQDVRKHKQQLEKDIETYLEYQKRIDAAMKAIPEDGLKH